MAFKIKDGVRIGTVDVFNNSGTLLVPAPAWITARTVTFAGGDVTGSFTIDGSANVNNVALTIAANSVTLGDDTTGNYVATVGAGTPGAETSSSGLTIVAAAGEGTAATIAHADTSTQATVNNAGNNFIQSIALDGFGHITSITSNPITVTETDTLQTVTTRGATSDVATISLTATTDSTNPTTGTLVVSGGVGIGEALNVGGNASVGGNLTVTGDLTVNGSLTTINSTQVSVDDINIVLGDTASPTDATANGGGITLRGTTDKTLIWVDATDRWTFNQGLEALSIQNTPIGSTTASTGAFTTLTASSTVTLSPANANVAISPSGTGTVTISPVGALTINPTAASTINNTSIGATTRSTGAFTTLAANGAVTFTAGTASTNTTSGTLVVTGGLGVSGRINAANFDGIIGANTAAAGTFTALTATGALTFNTTTNNQSFTTTGAGTITITSGTTGNINNMNIGATTRGTGAFTTLAANSTVSITGTENATSNATGVLRVDGGVSVDQDIYLSGNQVYATAAGVKVSEERALQTTVATTSATALDTWAIATYRYASYIVQITQGSDVQVSEVRIAHNGTTTFMTEYAVLETNGPLASAFTSDVSGGNARLLVTMGSATSATVKIIRTLVTI